VRGGGKLKASVPRVLVGETYLVTSSGLVVRVLDAKRAPAGPTGSFVVESATRSRPGERWVCREKDLQEPRADELVSFGHAARGPA
jgi:uncharacterized protein (DUF885 family)